MRIKQITVKNYGPVKDFHTKCESTHVIYGRNEAGKTALIDTITGALFRKKSIFPGQDRFGKNSSDTLKENVTLVLEHMGKEYIFPGPFKLEELMNLPHYHLAELFIIRAGDLTLREADKKWQDRVKEFLSGMPVNTERIREKIEEEVGLTPGGGWSDRKPMRKKSEIKKNRERKEALVRVIDRLENVHQKEKTLRDKLQKKEKLKQKNEKIKLLRSYLLRQRVKQAFSEWSRQKVSFLDYERYLVEDRKGWEEKEKTQDSLLNINKNCKGDIKEVKNELNEMDEEKNFLKEKKQKLITQKDRIVALSIFQDASKFLALREDITSPLIRLPFYRILGLVLALSGVFLFFTRGVQDLGGTFIFLLLGGGIYFLIFSYILKGKEFGLRRLEKSVLKRGRQIWPVVKSIDEVMQMYNSLDSKISQVEGKLEYITREREKRFKKLEGMEKDLELVEKKLSDTQEEIKKLRDKTGLSAFSQLEEKLNHKQKIRLNIQSREEILRDSLGTDDPSLWEEEAKKEVLRPDIDEEQLAEEEEVERKLFQLNNDIQDLRAEITSFTHGELGRLNIKEVTEVWKELKRTEDDLRLSYLEREAALLARDTLGQVSREMEKVLLDTVSDEKSGVSFYFNRITSGRYTGVRWGKESVQVTDSSGKDYPTHILSSGTQDQLFFSLRLGILKKGFPEGVFILLDDAFLTSDTTRREHQVRVCKRLAEEGWQIFYFTVDEKLRDLFCQVCEVEPIVL